MKILFVSKYEFYEPLGIMSLSSFLKKHRLDCYFIDIKLEKNFTEEIQKISPDIIAYSITTGNAKFYQKLNLELKKKFKFFSFFGGPHCTFFPEFISEEGVDAICRGEGEYPFLELVDNLEKEKGITKIKNLWIKINGEIYKNEVRNLIEDLDTLPFPDRDLVNKYKQYKKMHMRTLMTGRGCPYKCTYCFNHSYNKLYQKKGKIVRKRSIENVIKELKFIQKIYHPRKFQFWDDTFNIDYKWTLDFCDVYRKEIHIPFSVTPRVNLVNEEIVKALKNAGCITIATSIESGNDYLRNKILKRGLSEKQTIDACNLFNKYGIKVLMGNMIGLPDETLDMAFETMAFNTKCKPSYAWISIFQPLPRTELSNYSIEKGYFNGNFDSLDGSFYNKSVLKLKDIRKMERLHHLFSLGVEFPILIPLIKILIRLPLNGFYKFLFIAHKSWCYLFKLKYIDLSELFVRG
jgi:radical SAM superfamily enzyme YgiQ (UPF0313 family)